MDAQQILQSDLLDILFAGKNKDYGAYQLRRTYQRRLFMALGCTVAAICLVYFISTFSAGTEDVLPLRKIWVSETVLLNAPKEKKLMPAPEQPQMDKAKPVATIQYTRANISPDEEVMIAPPDVTALEKAQISLKTQEGVDYTGVIAPPETITGTNVVGNSPLSVKDESDVIVINVDIQASFPGGNNAWLMYVQRSIEQELDEFTDADYGTCIVKFIVDKTGKVSDVQASTMKGTRLAEIAVNAIRKGPKWIPAQQNGKYVNAYRIQPVTLRKP